MSVAKLQSYSSKNRFFEEYGGWMARHYCRKQRFVKNKNSEITH